MRIVTLALLVLLLGSCRLLADGPGAGRSGEDPDQPVGASLEPEPSTSPDGDGALREQPNPEVVQERGVGVDHFRIGPDGRTVVVYWWGGTPSCFALGEVLVEVQRGTPIVSVLEGTLPEAVGSACTMEAVLKSTVVMLDQPILVDGSGNRHPAGEPMTGDEALRTTPRDGVTDARAVALAGYRLSADGQQLDAYFVGGTDACYALAEASAVASRDGALTVTVREGRLPGVSQPCEDIGVLKVVGLALDEPLIVQAAHDS